MEAFFVSEQRPGIQFSPGSWIYNYGICQGDPSTAVGIFKPVEEVDPNAVMAALKVKLAAISSHDDLGIDEVSMFLGQLRVYAQYLSSEFLQMMEDYFSRVKLEPALTVINEIRVQYRR